jgi:SDR family mycofactocin-dependent oxidoreductase
MAILSGRRFEGKVAFVTGVARGQGRAIAVRLASEGADIIGLDICAPISTVQYEAATSDDLAQTVELIKAEGRSIVAVEGDVRDYSAVEGAIARGVTEFGHLDVAIANAGICTAARAWEITPEQWAETIGVNLTGVFHTARASVIQMLEQGKGGAIVMTSSVAGLRGLPLLAHYSASKHGVTGLCRAFANELGDFNIRVNSVHPTGVKTDMAMPELHKLLADRAETLGPIFMNTLPHPATQPEDIAAAVAWLASDEARHVTGIQLPIDLGTLAR